ncbi:MAG TPA: Na+/H+ antiporter subunit E [Desulfotignum sp.]|nr:Na+/H+ antiporter subunit E [Desulfotignum sp.]
MPLFLLNIFFAGVFTLLLGSGSIGVFVSGFAVGYLILWLSSPLYPETGYFTKLPKTLNLAAYFFGELMVSSLQVAWDVITPGHINRPGIIGVPLTARTDLEIFLVANLLSLTPGTLSVDLSEDKKILYVHVMFLQEIDKTRADIKNGLERRILEVMRS